MDSKIESASSESIGDNICVKKKYIFHSLKDILNIKSEVEVALLIPQR